jgi:hypothetical protein
MIDDALPIIFGEYFKHSDIAECARRLGSVTSAGFVTLTESSVGDITAEAHGESVSLNISAKPIDSKILTRVISTS